MPHLVSRATSIDMRVGLLFDGAVVYYDDNETVSCGPRKTVHGYDHTFGTFYETFLPRGCVEFFQIRGDPRFSLTVCSLLIRVLTVSAGGHASETITIPKNVDIRKVAICRSSDTLWGMRTYLTNGDEAGELNEGEGQVEILGKLMVQIICLLVAPSHLVCMFDLSLTGNDQNHPKDKRLLVSMVVVSGQIRSWKLTNSA